MALIVQKYGGTSVGTIERIQAVAERVKRWKDEGHDVVVVVSAMSGETDRLLGLARNFQRCQNRREVDVLVSTGEQVTIALVSMALTCIDVPAVSFTGAQVRIVTDSVHTKARIQHIDTDRIHAQLAEGKVVVIAGFQGVTEAGAITTLGRGGSDTSAVAIAAALKAAECQIYTDVDGVYTTDPRVEPKARKLDYITFEEMIELSGSGSKVLQIRSVEFAGKYKVPLRVLSSFTEGEGTLISFEEQLVEKGNISGIAFARDEAKISVLGVPDRPGVAYQILGKIADASIDVDMIVQNISNDQQLTDFTFTLSRNDYDQAIEILEQARNELGFKELTGDVTIAKLSLVGVGMRSHAGIASKMFNALAKAGINIRMISTSEIKVSVIIDEGYLEQGVRALHEAFHMDLDPQNQDAGSV